MQSKKKLKREDFVFQNAWFQSKIKGPGQLHMQQFQISDCEQCNIFLFDSAACVYIDQCKFCNVFVGACESSVFIRDCQHVNVICATQQFRVRDSFHCYFSIFCESQPIIESSHDISISCFPEVGYEEMESQMIQAKINPWSNNWFDVYDFTPNKFGRVNYDFRGFPSFLWEQFREKLQAARQGIKLKSSKTIIPRVLGRTEVDISNLFIFVVYPPPKSSSIGDTTIIQSRLHRLSAEEISQLKLPITSNEIRTSVLFLKLDNKNSKIIRTLIKEIIEQISDRQALQLYEAVIFAPFKDDR